MNGEILRNSIITPDGSVLTSKHIYDYVGYTDKNGQFYSVDGGNEYTKRNFDKQDWVENCVYSTDSIEKVREVFNGGLMVQMVTKKNHISY